MASTSASSRVESKPLPEKDTGSFTRAIGPLLAAFSLPTIAQLVGEHPTPWGSIACFLVGTGLLLAGFQFSITDWFPELTSAVAILRLRRFRAFLTWSGMVGVIIGLGLLAVHVKGLLWAPIVLLWSVGIVVPAICLAAVKIRRLWLLGWWHGTCDTTLPDLPSDRSEALLTEIRDALVRLAASDRAGERGVD